MVLSQTKVVTAARCGMLAEAQHWPHGLWRHAIKPDGNTYNNLTHLHARVGDQAPPYDDRFWLPDSCHQQFFSDLLALWMVYFTRVQLK